MSKPGTFLSPQLHTRLDIPRIKRAQIHQTIQCKISSRSIWMTSMYEWRWVSVAKVDNSIAFACIWREILRCEEPYG